MCSVANLDTAQLSKVHHSLARHPMEFLLTKKTSDEENKDPRLAKVKAGIKKIALQRYFLRELTVLVRDRHSGIKVSLVPLQAGISPTLLSYGNNHT